MQTELLMAVFAGLGGMLGWGLADFFAKKTIDKIGDVVSLAWGHVFGTIILVIAAVYRWIAHDVPVTFSLGSNIWLVLIVFGIAQAAVYFLAYRGFGKGQISILAPVFASFAGITAVMSIIIFSEPVSSTLLLVLALIFVGIILINLDLSALVSNRIGLLNIPGMKEVGPATLMAGFWTLFWDRAVTDRDWLSFTLFMYFFMTVAILAYCKIRHVNLSGIDASMWKFLFFIGAGETVAYLAVSLGYSATSLTSVVALLSGAFSLPTIVLAYIFLKERILKIQVVGCVVVVTGIILLSLV